MQITTNSVRKYYEQNTSLFLMFSGTKRAPNIHRSLWTKNTQTLEEALNASNQMIVDEIGDGKSLKIADLGCGVGASLFYIVPRLQNPSPAFGITLSPSQALIAQKSAKKQGLEKQIYFAEGDFTHVPLPNESLDIIYSVEAVCHAVHPEKYFKEAGRLLKKGGKLILVDDYQTSRELTSHEIKWLNAYIEGWHVPGVRRLEKTMEFAKENRLQLIKNVHLTPNLKLRNLPDPIAEFLLFAGGLLPIRHAILPSMVGSMALQQCLHMGIIEYHFLVFEK